MLRTSRAALLLPFLVVAVPWGASCVTSTKGPVAEKVSSRSLLARGDAYFDGRQYENALETYKLAAVAARSEEDEGRFVEAAAQVAHASARLDQVDDGRVWLVHAEKGADPERAAAWARVLLARGVYAEADGDRGAALAAFAEAHRFARDTGQTVRAVQAAHLASGIATGEEQVQWCRRSLESAEEVGDPRLVAAVWTQLAWLLEERGLAQDALVAFRQAQRATSETDDRRQELVADWSLGHGLRMAGETESARLVLEDALERAERRRRALRRPNDAEWVGHCQRELAELDLLEGEDAQALARLEDARRKFLLAGVERHAPSSLAALDQRIAEVRARLGVTPSGGTDPGTPPDPPSPHRRE